MLKRAPGSYETKLYDEEDLLLTLPDPQGGPPIACSLPETARQDQAEKWRAFGADYELSIETHGC
ncbi:MAG: hypothetical protein ABWY57_05390 [Mycetocola sp.]